MTTEQDEALIRRTFEIAAASVEHGNHPFGSLLVYNGEVILEAENTVMRTGDPTQHAEINLVQEAMRRFDPQIVRASTVYASTEPCAMCCGAIYWAGIPAVVYGCGGDVLEGSLAVTSRSVFEKGARPTAVTGPVLQHEGVPLHEAFWPTLAAGLG
jgi:tRNA(Arg) A34 adenosine deaminase TadA